MGVGVRVFFSTSRKGLASRNSRRKLKHARVWRVRACEWKGVVEDELKESEQRDESGAHWAILT